MKRKFKQSTNINKTNNYLSPRTFEHKKLTAYGIGNTGPGLGQAQKGGWVKLVNRMPCILAVCLR